MVWHDDDDDAQAKTNKKIDTNNRAKEMEKRVKQRENVTMKTKKYPYYRMHVSFCRHR